MAGPTRCSSNPEELMRIAGKEQEEQDVVNGSSRRRFRSRSTVGLVELNNQNVLGDMEYNKHLDSNALADAVISKRLLRHGLVPLEESEIDYSDNDSSSRSHGCIEAPEPSVLPFWVKHAVDEVHRSLFGIESGHSDSVQRLLSNYCQFALELGIPIDRLFYGGTGFHEKLTAYTCIWEPGRIKFREMPRHIFDNRHTIFGKDEPMVVLEKGLVEHVRIKATDDYIPADTEKWFRGENYVDYFALPDLHNGLSKGGFAWATKHPSGFSSDHLTFFKLTLPALRTVLRLHANELALRSLTDKMENEIEERTLELQEANGRLEKANTAINFQAKKQLQHFACMSHEIRTPLNCIVGLSSILLETPPEEVTTAGSLDSIRLINSSAELLTAVVDDVLDYSKLESGVFEVDIRESSLQETLNSVVHAMKEKAAEKQVRILTFLSPILPDNFHTDSRRLQQVLYNLLGNSCKFSEIGGKVELHVSVVEGRTSTLESEISSKDDKDIAAVAHAQEKEVKRRLLRFVVKDFGKGIEKKDFKSIFEPFNQASKETQTIYGGTGLGLSITSALVNRLGGTISVDSQVGEFSEFTVDLPYDGTTISVDELSSKFKKTTLVILEGQDGNHRGQSSLFEMNGPFCPDVIRLYHLDVVKARSWENICELIEDESSNNFCRIGEAHHILVVAASHINPVTGDCLVGGAKYEDLLSMDHSIGADQAKQWSLFTHGPVQPPKNSPFLWSAVPSLQSTLPSLLLEGMVEHLTAYSSTVHKTPRSEGISSFSLKTNAAGGLGKASCVTEDMKGICVENDSTGTAMSDVGHQTNDQSCGATMSTAGDVQILIAEDNLVNQKVLGRVLKKLGLLKVDVVDNGQKAVDAAKRTEYDIIFMDMQMPVMDGLEASRLIKSHQTSTSNTKIIFCTAHAIDDFRLKAEFVGADGFISKPFNLERIRVALQDYMDV